MNLKEEMDKYSIYAFQGEFGESDEGVKAVSFDKAIGIAEKYAEEMCKEQIELCVKELAKELFLGEVSYDNIPILQTVKKTPLATEIK